MSRVECGVHVEIKRNNSRFCAVFILVVSTLRLKAQTHWGVQGVLYGWNGYNSSLHPIV